ncbi:MAG: UDP-N-acetylmuramoyl-L-alanyl-D-glutamate--2,6-diaminopimelate ligase [Pseudomonadota bacterium]
MAQGNNHLLLRRLHELIGSTAGSCGELTVSGVQLDSRKVQPGDLFLAVPGDAHDGRQFIEQAVAAGAAAVVAQAPVAGFVDDVPVPLLEHPELAPDVGSIAAAFYGRPTSAMNVVGCTGTNGKTTVSRLIAQLFRLLDQQCGVVGTLGMSLADDIAEAINTTPDAVSLQAQLARWHTQGVPHVAMEVSSHALEQGRVNGTDFNVAVFTNLSHDHLDYHGTMAAYGQAKARLFRWPGLETAIINVDDEFGAALASTVSADCLRYSASNSHADLYLKDIRYDDHGATARLFSPWGEGVVHSPLPGAFNLSNLLAAIAAVACRGVPLQSVIDAVPSLRGVPGRMQLIAAPDYAVVVDYAHTPDALEQVLCALRPHVSNRLIVVFGCGGDRDPDKRPVMGRIASQLADVVVITSDNPRSEEPQAILEDIARGCETPVTTQVDRGVAIDQAIDLATQGDCVLIAGKGHEDYQIVGADRLHFSDAEHAAQAIRRRAGA